LSIYKHFSTITFNIKQPNSRTPIHINPSSPTKPPHLITSSLQLSSPSRVSSPPPLPSSSYSKSLSNPPYSAHHHSSQTASSLHVHISHLSSRVYWVLRDFCGNGVWRFLLRGRRRTCLLRWWWLCRHLDVLGGKEELINMYIFVVGMEEGLTSFQIFDFIESLFALFIPLLKFCYLNLFSEFL
jgi:hypothetical protein